MLTITECFKAQVDRCVEHIKINIMYNSQWSTLIAHFFKKGDL